MMYVNKLTTEQFLQSTVTTNIVHYISSLFLMWCRIKNLSTPTDHKLLLSWEEIIMSTPLV